MKLLVSMFPGLRVLVVEEMAARLGLAPVATGRARGSELVWVQTSDPAGLLGLRLVEDVFVVVETIPLSGKTVDLKAVTAALGRPEVWESALRAQGHLAGRPTPARVVFRVVAQADDAAWRGYRRVDLQRAAEAGVGRARPGWRLNAGEAPFEVWLHQVGRNLTVSLRLTSGVNRARGGRAVERAAALRPTIAAAMVRLSEPADDDVFLDPLCGTGTILLERALAGRHGLLLGGDIDVGAVKAAVANFGPRHKPVRIERMDARKLPLEDASVDKLVTNLPWGKQIGRPEDLPALYGGMLAEAVRVVRPGGLVVVLTSEVGVLDWALKSQPGFVVRRRVTGIEVLGRPAEMRVLARR
ncbi:MAG TPA: methyltransferase domain-containing protein [Candidatus Saccharimonadia bacterium]|nr:methyltransferase domain-containing protein [Candidatus Saccharimonadia bacterium]